MSNKQIYNSIIESRKKDSEKMKSICFKKIPFGQSLPDGHK